MSSSAEMPFLDHLEELRWRIIWSLAALVVGVVVGFFIVIKFNLLVWMQTPILPYLHGRRLMNTHPGGGFSIMMQTAIILGVVIALPVIIYQVWLFLSPALHRHEKKVAVPVILGAVGLFVAGAALAWYFVLPMTLKFLTHMGDEAFEQMISANEYFGFVTTMVLADGCGVRAAHRDPAAVGDRARHAAVPREVPAARGARLVSRRGDHHPRRLVRHVDRADDSPSTSCMR